MVNDSHDIDIEEWIELRPDYNSLKGSILAEWSRKHGSSREKIYSLRIAGLEDTEELLQQETDYDGTRLVLSVDEIKKKTQQELREYLRRYLTDWYYIDSSFEYFMEYHADQDIIDFCGL